MAAAAITVKFADSAVLNSSFVLRESNLDKESDTVPGFR